MSSRKSDTGKLISYLLLIVIFVSVLYVGHLSYGEYLKPRFIKYKLNHIQDLKDDPLERTYDWGRLKEINPDIIGWLWIPGTIVDYPVVQTTDNDLYLYTGFDGSHNKYGTLFLDCRYQRDNPLAKNQTIYGHSSSYTNRVMFSRLRNYIDDPNYLKEHPTIYYTRVDEGDKPIPYRILHILHTDAMYGYNAPTFNNYEQFLTYYNGKIMLDSKISTHEEITEEDEILTLSTCVFDIPDGRLAVIAKKAN